MHTPRQRALEGLKENDWASDATRDLGIMFLFMCSWNFGALFILYRNVSDLIIKEMPKFDN